jgi:type IV pilus assembly protein PilW
MRRPKNSAARVAASQAGVTLLELLIAISLSILVIGAALSLFAANRNTASSSAAVSSVSDNGRVALSFLSESVRSAGYMACNATNDLRQIATGTTRQQSILQPGATPVQRNYTAAFGGYEAVGSTPPAGAVNVVATPVAADGNLNDWTGSGGLALDGLLAGRVTQGSDVLVVRETTPQSIPIYTTGPYTTGTGQVTLPVNSIGTLTAGQYAVISDCIVSTAFQVGAAGGGIINTAGPLDLFGGDLNWNYDVTNTITPVDMQIYFIGPGRDTDSSLWQYDETTAQFQELVPDVENMQVLYGVAPTTPNQVTQYLTANAVVDFNQVVAVKVALLVASPPGAPAVTLPTAATVQPFSLLDTTINPPLDTRLRKVLNTTIAVRNAAL